MRKKLKPCAHCGGTATIQIVKPHSHKIADFMHDYPGGAFVHCTGCTLACSGTNEKEAIAMWNSRITPQWTAEKPTKEGIYLFCCKEFYSHPEPVIIRYRTHDNSGIPLKRMKLAVKSPKRTGDLDWFFNEFKNHDAIWLKLDISPYNGK